MPKSTFLEDELRRESELNKSLLDKCRDAFKKFLQIHSPSELGIKRAKEIKAAKTAQRYNLISTYDIVYIYVPGEQQIVKISKGSGDNLLYEQCNQGVFGL